jgi:hypothetical protein
MVFCDSHKEEIFIGRFKPASKASIKSCRNKDKQNRINSFDMPQNLRFFMYNETRYNRVRLLVHGVNQGRKRQARKIDILCNDLVSAHRNLIKRTETLRFAANFYQSIIAIKNLDDLLDTAGSFLENEIKDATIIFFLKQAEGFSIYSAKNQGKDGPEEQSFESFITSETANEICRYNRPCNLEDMMAMGLQVVPSMLNKLSAFAVPLFTVGNSIGFILIYRSSDEKIPIEQVDMADCVSNGLARAIMACQTVYAKSE